MARSVARLIAVADVAVAAGGAGPFRRGDAALIRIAPRGQARIVGRANDRRPALAHPAEARRPVQAGIVLATGCSVPKIGIETRARRRNAFAGAVTVVGCPTD